MPDREGFTPSFLKTGQRHAWYDHEREAWPYRHGVYELDQVGLSPLNRGGLYGDVCFESMRITQQRVNAYREHLRRWWQSAQRLNITILYTQETLGWLFIEAMRSMDWSYDDIGSVRAVVARGMGKTGIRPGAMPWDLRFIAYSQRILLCLRAVSPRLWTCPSREILGVQISWSWIQI